MIGLTEQMIDPQQLLTQVRTPQAGAVVLFLGTTRDHSDQGSVQSLDYECYREMAAEKLKELERQVRSRWTSLLEIGILHRVGRVPVGEISVAIAVSSPHRQEAFAAGQWLIDSVKQVVPIWKKENRTDGTSQWLHPARQNHNSEVRGSRK